MFGRNLFVVNCNEDVTVGVMMQYMMGMVQSGSWTLFDDTDRLTKGKRKCPAPNKHRPIRKLDTVCWNGQAHQSKRNCPAPMGSNQEAGHCLMKWTGSPKVRGIAPPLMGIIQSGSRALFDDMDRLTKGRRNCPAPNGHHPIRKLDTIWWHGQTHQR